MSDTRPVPPDLRTHIGRIGGDPVTSNPDLSGLTELERSLRQVVIREFRVLQSKKFVEKQVKHINSNQQLAEGLRFLFDEHGQPPANAPMEDIVEERRRLEYEIKWFEAIVAELQLRLTTLREIEDGALDMLGQRSGNDLEPGFR